MTRKTASFICKNIFLVFFFVACSSAKVSQDNSQIVSNLIDAGNSLAQGGKFSEALDKYKRALIMDDSSSTAKRNVGIVLVKLGRFEEGLKYFYEVRSLYQADSEFLYFFGEGLRGLKSYNQSLEFYIKAKELAPNDSRILKSLGWVYLKTGNLKEAERIIAPYFREKNNDLQAILIMSHILNKKKKYSQAIKILKNFEDSRFSIVGRNKLIVETEKILLLEALGNAYEGLNNCKKAFKVYSIVLDLRPFLVSSLNGSARCELMIDQKASALLKLEKSIATEPSNPETLYLLGNAYLSSDSKRSKFYYGRFLDEARKESFTYSSEILKASERLSQLNGSNSQAGTHFN